jgi:OOP family OmpA-OmpF porin
VSSRGHGEADPVAPNSVNGEDNPSGRALNRRVTIAFPRD